MDQEDIATILTVFTTSQRQLLMMLKLLMNDNKRIQHTPFDIRHSIKQLAYFPIIYESDLVYCQGTRMDKRCFSILCHLLKTTARLTSKEIVDVEEMVAMFFHVVVHDVKNQVIQREFVWFDETTFWHSNIVLLVVLRLHDELLKKSQPVTNACTNLRWK